MLTHYSIHINIWDLSRVYAAMWTVFPHPLCPRLSPTHWKDKLSQNRLTLRSLFTIPVFLQTALFLGFRWLAVNNLNELSPLGLCLWFPVNYHFSQHEELLRTLQVYLKSSVCPSDLNWHSFYDLSVTSAFYANPASVSAIWSSGLAKVVKQNAKTGLIHLHQLVFRPKLAISTLEFEDINI